MSEQDDATASRPSMHAAPDVPTTFVELMLGMTDGTAWAPIEVIEEVFPSIQHGFDGLAIWALKKQNAFVLSWCGQVLDAGLAETVKGFVDTVCEVLPQWHDNGVLMVALSLVDGPEGPGSRAQVLGISRSDYAAIEQSHGFESGTLSRWREDFEALSQKDQRSALDDDDGAGQS